MQIALTSGQLTYRVENALMFLGPHESIGDIVVDIDVTTGRGMVAQRDEAATVVVAGQVEHDRAKVRRGPIDRFDPARVPGKPKERLLHDILGCIAVVHEQARQPHE